MLNMKRLALFFSYLPPPTHTHTHTHSHTYRQDHTTDPPPQPHLNDSLFHVRSQPGLDEQGQGIILVLTTKKLALFFNSSQKPFHTTIPPPPPTYTHNHHPHQTITTISPLRLPPSNAPVLVRDSSGVWTTSRSPLCWPCMG